MVSEPPNSNQRIREEMAQLMFETFGVRCLYFANQPVLSLFASARTTGTVLDSGHGVTHCVPIYEGYAIPHAILTMPLGGKDLSEYMYNMINKSGIIDKHDEDSQEFDIDCARQIKESYCLVAQDFDAEMKAAQENKTIDREYVLPVSNKKITLST